MEPEVVKQIKLIPVQISYNYSDNVWTFFPFSGVKLAFKADHARVKRLLRRIKAKDSIIYPNKLKKVSYQAIINDIVSKNISTVYVWKSKCPTTLDLLIALMEE